MRLSRAIIIACSMSLYFIALVLNLLKDFFERSRISFDRLRTSAVLLTFFTISLGKSTPGLISFTTTDTDPHTKEITINFTVPKKDFIYKDFITCSVDDPHITLSPWKANKPTVAHYDSSFKEAKQIFNQDFSVAITATAKKSVNDHIYLYCSYYRHADKKINHVQFPLFFTAMHTDINEMIDTTLAVTEEYEPTQKIRHKVTIVERYYVIAFHIIYVILSSLRTDHKKYFALLLFLLSVLISFFYFFREELQKQIRIKELLEIMISLLSMTITTYILIYMYIISTPLITMIMACVCTLCAGFFYIQKSTKVQSKNLRTLCTLLGILCICSTLLLSFKALQYADHQFNLF
jgi:hypothetical protein